jgi:hypothetical protein
MRHSRQQTVHVAVTRRMAPSAHILAYFIDYTGELVADVIHFHVNITSDTVVLNLTINQRKDLTGETVELLAYGPPQARIAFAGTEYAQYQLYGVVDGLLHPKLKFSKRETTIDMIRLENRNCRVQSFGTKSVSMTSTLYIFLRLSRR